MKSIYFVLILIIFFGMYSKTVFSQRLVKTKDFPERLPKIELDEKTPLKYLMIIENKDYDLYGNFYSKKRVSGEYTRGLKDGYVKWNNVTLANSQNLKDAFLEGIKQNYMENFTYKPTDNIVSESFFKDIPEADFTIKTIVWDMFTFEYFAWNYWDSLKLNQPYSAVNMNAAFQIEKIGTMENKDVRITWIGFTKKNNKICSVIKFVAMNNPMNFNVYNTEIRGRSHYWGTIYVSMNDKQIEYGELNEDIVMDIKTKGNETGNKVNTNRYITLEKLH